MIKLRDLIKEASRPMTPMDIKLYWNFVLNALSGHNPDAFYRSHRQSIELVAEAMRTKYGPTSGGTVYRGIIIDPVEFINGKINHVPEVTYISFSEDKRIALAFADTENPISEYVLQLHPTWKGYLITSTFRPDESLLFHHKWFEDTNMWPTVTQLFGDHTKFMEMQKEVITKPKPYYRAEPVEPGISGGIIVGA